MCGFSKDCSVTSVYSDTLDDEVNDNDGESLLECSFVIFLNQHNNKLGQDAVAVSRDVFPKFYKF